MITYLVDREASFTIRDYLELYAPALAARFDVVCYEELAERPALRSGAFVFSALDRLTPEGLGQVQELADQVAAHPGCRIFNHPRRVLLRLALLEELRRRGLNRHGAVRASGNLGGLRYPVFVREESRHTGNLSPLLWNRRELAGELGQAVLRGYRLDELLVVEFCESVEPDGRYAKYAAFKIGDRVIADGLVRGDSWMLKSDTRELSEAAIMEERGYILNNPHEQALRGLFELAGVEYGRIDYSLVDGRIESWEINTNPTIRRGRRPELRPTPPELDQLKNVARKHFLGLFQAALGELDEGLPDQPIAIRCAARRMIQPARPAAWRAAVAKALRPMNPVLKAVGKLLGRWLVPRGAPGQ